MTDSATGAWVFAGKCVTFSERRRRSSYCFPFSLFLFYLLADRFPPSLVDKLVRNSNEMDDISSSWHFGIEWVGTSGT